MPKQEISDTPKEIRDEFYERSTGRASSPAWRAEQLMQAAKEHNQLGLTEEADGFRKEAAPYEQIQLGMDLLQKTANSVINTLRNENLASNKVVEIVAHAIGEVAAGLETQARVEALKLLLESEFDPTKKKAIMSAIAKIAFRGYLPDSFRE